MMMMMMMAQARIASVAIAADFEYLETAAEGEFSISSRTRDDRQWIVVYSGDAGPTRYYHYDRDGHKLRFLFTNRKALEKAELANMQPVVIDARDGQKLVSYLTLPVGAANAGSFRPSKTQPMVLLVHGTCSCQPRTGSPVRPTTPASCATAAS